MSYNGCPDCQIVFRANGNEIWHEIWHCPKHKAELEAAWAAEAEELRERAAEPREFELYFVAHYKSGPTGLTLGPFIEQGDAEDAKLDLEERGGSWCVVKTTLPFELVD